jgi:hypothetical protein
MELRKYYLYRIWDTLGLLLYIGKNANGNPDGRIASHRKSWWGHEIFKHEMVTYETEAALNEAEVRAIQNEKPKYNKIYNGKPVEVSKEEMIMEGKLPANEFIKPKYPQGEWETIIGSPAISGESKPIDIARWHLRGNGALVLTLGHPNLFSIDVHHVLVIADFKTRLIMIHEVPRGYPNSLILGTVNGSDKKGRNKYRKVVFYKDQNPFHEDDKIGFSAQYTDPNFPGILFLKMPDSFRKK